MKDNRTQKILLDESYQSKFWLYIRYGEDAKIIKTFAIEDLSPVKQPARTFNELKEATQFFYR